MAGSREQLSAAEERFDLWRRRVGLPLGLFGAILIYLLLPGLPSDERRLSAVLFLVVVFWITEAIPIPVTALLGPSLCVLLGIAGAREVFQPFASPIIFVFLGGFLLARGMTVNGLDRRVALGILRAPAIGNSPERIRLAVGGVAALLSMWISNTATVAMLFPIVVGISDTLDRLFATGGGELQRAGRSYLTGLMLLTAYGCSIGGLATPVGTPPNLIGLGFIDSLAGRKISFFEWMQIGIPVALGMFVLAALLMRFLHPSPTRRLEGVDTELGEFSKAIPEWGRAQTFTTIAFLTAVVLWVAPGLVAAVAGKESTLYRLLSSHLQEGAVALLAASLLFLLPVGWTPLRGALSWREAVKIDWGTILLFGGGLSLGGLMHSTGLAERVARGFLGGDGEVSVWMITAAAALFATFFTEVASNTATAGMLVPVTIAVAQAAGVSPLPPAIGATIGCSLAFMLPVSTPPNAIMYGSGRIGIVKMIKAGLWLDVLGFFVLMGLLLLLLPVLGLS